MSNRPASRKTRVKKRYEDHIVVLDYLPEGYLSAKPPFKRDPIIQAVGEYFFTLLELSIIQPNTHIELHQRISISKDKMGKIAQVKRRIPYNELTATARAELPSAIDEIVTSQSKRFVNWYNQAQPITTRMHQLSLLPGIGEKYLWSVLNEKKKSPFTSFEDIKERTGLPHPKRLIIRRILLEMERDDVKYRLFTRSFKPSEEEIEEGFERTSQRGEEKEGRKARKRY